jgi:lipopolysaccharide transport system ATP-binding protein
VTEAAKLYRAVEPAFRSGNDVKNLFVEGVSKRYWVPKTQRVEAAKETRFDRVRNFLSLPLTRDILNARELWALNDVSFDVDQGTVLGVIGANGAGKSTLLKVIAKVIAPTAGRVRGRGRVVSLLELGTGFDDEATARENIYMNAAINGIPRAVANRRFDSIVEFAEIQEFVDTPLQFFSSGMYLRLAFSVAINMEPSILLADEILAVGDAAFQERCLQKVRDLARERGLTVLFVSHDMEAVSRICDRVLWIKSGLLHRDGQPEEVITEYQNATWDALSEEAPGYKGTSHAARYGEIVDVKLLAADGREVGSPSRAEDVHVRIRFRTRRAKARVRCSIDVMTKGVLVLRSSQPEPEPVAPEKVYEALVRIPANLLAETTYTVNVSILLVRGDGEEHALVVNKALAFMVYGDQHDVDSAETRHRKGVVNPPLDWSMDTEQHVVRV